MTNNNLDLQTLADNAPDRRRFLGKLGLAAAAAGAVVGTATDAQAQGITDVDILQFALNLEYLEAEFYTVATTGMTIAEMGIGITGSGTSGQTTGGRRVNLNNSLVFTQTIAEQLGVDERTHVTYLRTALQQAGVTPVAKPAINLNALGAGFNSQNDFLLVARALEDIGVTAYAGAAPLIQSRAYLGVAARILAVEAFHAGNIRLQIARLRVATQPLDGVDVLPPPTGVKFFTADNDALSGIRTPGQVLYLAYGNRANAMNGGFYPNGMNGTLRMSSAAA